MTPEELKKLNKELLLNAALDLLATNETLTDSQGTALEEIAQLREENQKLTEENKELTEENKELNSTLKDMNKVLEDLNEQKEDQASGLKVVKYGKDRFQVLTPAFKLNQKQYSFADLKSNEDLVKSILAIEGQGILKPLN